MVPYIDTQFATSSRFANTWLEKTCFLGQFQAFPKASLYQSQAPLPGISISFLAEHPRTGAGWGFSLTKHQQKQNRSQVGRCRRAS